jgi:hypothetical protein
MARKKKPTNSLERFRKASPRLVLEEHDHCEVPAGCGGVVLRWRNPQAALPYLLHLYAPATSWHFWVDAVEVKNSRFDLPPGKHVLAVAFEEVELFGAVLACVLRYDPADRGSRQARDKPNPRNVVSAGDGTWKASREPPEESWFGLEFDDSTWPAMVEMNAPQLDRGARGAYRLSHCRELGAACLGLPPAVAPTAPMRGSLWVRKAFTVAPVE